MRTFIFSHVQILAELRMIFTWWIICCYILWFKAPLSDYFRCLHPVKWLQCAITLNTIMYVHSCLPTFVFLWSKSKLYMVPVISSQQAQTGPAANSSVQNKPWLPPSLSECQVFISGGGGDQTGAKRRWKWQFCAIALTIMTRLAYQDCVWGYFFFCFTVEMFEI